MLEMTCGQYLPFTDLEASGAETYYKRLHYGGYKGRWL
jgi:hypothetical protein